MFVGSVSYIEGDQAPDIATDAEHFAAGNQ